MTVDNEYTLFLDGREMGRGAEWRELYDYNLTPLMSPGRHILAVNAVNSFSYAGLLLGMRVDLTDGRVIEVKSDESWRIAPVGTKGWEKAAKVPATWPKAKIVAQLGSDPWWSTPTAVHEMPTLQPIKLFFGRPGGFKSPSSRFAPPSYFSVPGSWLNWPCTKRMASYCNASAPASPWTFTTTSVRA